MTSTALPLRRAMSANSTATSFTAKIPVNSEPEGNGVFDLHDADNGIAIHPYVPRYIQLIPYGVNSNDDQINMRVWGWSRVANENLWIPQLLLEIAYTLGNISASVVGSSHFMADTIAITYGDADAPEISPANDLAASILLHIRGSRYLEFDFDLHTGATEANCFWRPMDQD